VLAALAVLRLLHLVQTLDVSVGMVAIWETVGCSSDQLAVEQALN
jgi:hypothetical protein